MQGPANDAADYLDRFPAAHRASADRAYQDGFADARAELQPIIEAARALLAAFGGDVPAWLRRDASALAEALEAAGE